MKSNSLFRKKLMWLPGLLILASCSYSEPEDRPPFAPTLMDSTVFPSATPKSPVVPAEKFSEDFLATWEKTSAPQALVSRDFYDFESEEARKWRALAKSPDALSQLAQNISLEMLLCFAYERNPELESYKKKFEAVGQRYSQAEFLYNILEQYAGFTTSLQITTGPSLQTPMIAEKAPFPKALALMGSVITTELEMAKLDHLMALRDLMARLKSDYFELIFLTKAVAIYEEQERLVGELEAVARDNFKSNLAVYGDVLKAQIVKAQVAVELETYRQQLSSFQVRLLTTLNLPATARLGRLPEPELKQLTIGLDEATALGRENRQELQLIRVEEKKLTQLITMARADLYPNLTLGLSYLQAGGKMGNQAMSGTADNGRVEVPPPEKMAEFSEQPTAEPRFFFGQRDSYLREMILERRALEKREESAVQETIAGIKDLYVALDVAWRSLVLSRDTLVPLAKENLKASQSAYQGQKVDFLDVVSMARMALESRLEWQKSQKDYRQKLAQLEKMVGCRLEKP